MSEKSNRPVKKGLRLLFSPALSYLNSRFEHIDRRCDQLLRVIQASGENATRVVRGIDKLLPVMLENLSTQNAAIREARLEAVELKKQLEELTSAVDQLTSEVREHNKPAS